MGDTKNVYVVSYMDFSNEIYEVYGVYETISDAKKEIALILNKSHRNLDESRIFVDRKTLGDITPNPDDGDWIVWESLKEKEDWQ